MGGYRDLFAPLRLETNKMPAKVYYENDANLSLLKDKTIAILGYGAQGRGPGPKPARQWLQGDRGATTGLDQL